MESPEFLFPFEPYSIQREFMLNLYETLNKGGVGIFESPTGTGKSMSILCGSLQWLLDAEKTQGKQSEGDTADDELDWVRDFDPDSEKKEFDKRTKRIEKAKQRIATQKVSELPSRRVFPRKRAREKTAEEEEEDLMLDDWDSDGDQGPKVSIVDSSDDEYDEDDEDVQKVIYCSRTHSQLSQFINEVKKTEYAKKIVAISVVSRKVFCINSQVNHLPSAKLNEACLDMKKSKKSATEEGGKCPYLSKTAQESFLDHTLTEMRDIEDLVRLGEELTACPYYGSRRTVKNAQLVCLPYNSLIQKDLRESLGLSLKNNVVIIDEAHNLLDSINSAHAAQLSAMQAVHAYGQLSKYRSRYEHRLKDKNLLYINEILDCIKQILKYLNCVHLISGMAGGHSRANAKVTAGGSGEEVVSISDFVFKTNLDNINMRKLERYVKDSQIMQKLGGFVDKYIKEPAAEAAKKQRDHETPHVMSPFAALGSVLTFLVCLVNRDKDGRIMVKRCSDTPEKSSLSFILLNPESYFEDILSEARSVVLAGGTMQPVSDYVQQLFPNIGDRLHLFSCGHIIPKEQILPLCVRQGPSKKTFDFSFSGRQNNVEMVDDLGALILNVCRIVPGGVVVFFPSYGYEEEVMKRWTEKGILNSIEAKKSVFRELRTGSIEDVLTLYRLSIEESNQPRYEGDSRTGALLTAVVGGKMSEGINFNDDLARCVVMIGLPFANQNDPELKERMRYWDEKSRSMKALGIHSVAGSNVIDGREFYENMCMKAVNQSIGRSVRHAKDYSTILLVDERFCTRQSVQGKLPKWMQPSLVNTSNYGQVHKALGTFPFFRKNSFK